jgi:ribosomal 30S subunit maturation factor RimM
LIGIIATFYDYPGNPCIGIKTSGSERESLLPLHDDLIIKADLENGKITLDLPEGILDI